MQTVDFNNLDTSIDVYSPIKFDLWLKWSIIVPDEHKDQANTGLSYIDFLLSSVVDYNRCFMLLLEKNEVNAALPLIRLQADNLRVLYMEHLYPDKVLPKIYKDEKELKDIKINGQELNGWFVNGKVNDGFSRFREIYKKYNAYVHPSIKLHKYLIAGTNIPKPNPFDAAFEAKFDMVYINKAIIYTLEYIDNYYMSLIHQNPDLECKYKEKVEGFEHIDKILSDISKRYNKQ